MWCQIDKFFCNPIELPANCSNPVSYGWKSLNKTTWNNKRTTSNVIWSLDTPNYYELLSVFHWFFLCVCVCVFFFVLFSICSIWLCVDTLNIFQIWFKCANTQLRTHLRRDTSCAKAQFVLLGKHKRAYNRSNCINFFGKYRQHLMKHWNVVDHYHSHNEY